MSDDKFEVKKTFGAQEINFNSEMTVGDLKRILDGKPDDVRIVMHTMIPDTHEDVVAVIGEVIKAPQYTGGLMCHKCNDITYTKDTETPEHSSLVFDWDLGLTG